MNGMNGFGGLGDIAPKFSDPLETYYDIMRQGITLPRKKFVVSPDFEPCRVDVPPGPGSDVAQKIIDAQQQMMECHTIPRQWQLLTDLWQKLQCGTYFVKNPNWIEPPITAQTIDQKTPAPVVVAPGLTAVVVAFTISDRHVGSILKVANSVCAAADYANILWTIRVNKNPVRAYNEFQGQLAAINSPVSLPNPIPLKHFDVIDVTAKNIGAAPVETFARVAGFQFPAKDISQAGSYEQYHTL